MMVLYCYVPCTHHVVLLLLTLLQSQQKELGLPDDADEYDLDEALKNNSEHILCKI
jgi:hypothetical protein